MCVQANTNGQGVDNNSAEHQLTRLILDGEELERGPGEAFYLLSMNSSLVHLTLRDCRIVGINGRMSDSIGRLQLLRTLNLSGNDIGGADAAGFGLLSGALRCLPLLYSLDLSNTSMAGCGLSKLELSAFSALRSLTHLRLQGNQLG